MSPRYDDLDMRKLLALDGQGCTCPRHLGPYDPPREDSTQ